jgi:hypothetical protein
MDTIDEVEVKCCIACSTEIDSENDDIYTTSKGDPVCGDCMIMCTSCEDIITVGDEYNEVQGELWCAICTRNNAHWCDICEQHFSGYTYGTDDSNIHFL